MTDINPLATSFIGLYETVRRLRGPGGCPWDIEQTPESLRETLIEESYETVEAITEGDAAHVREELGDVFLNAVMLSYMYEQKGLFTVSEVLAEVTGKLVRRHPHVFGETEGFDGPSSDGRTKTAESVLNQWETIKQTVEGRSGDSILSDVSRGLPALERAKKLQKRASKHGFDWPSVTDVWPKLEEELGELKKAIHEGDHQSIEGELGDLLFSVVNVARHLGVDPGVALTATNAKFTDRFTYVEKEMKKAGVPMDGAHLKEMDRLWDEAKKGEKS